LGCHFITWLIRPNDGITLKRIQFDSLDSVVTRLIKNYLENNGTEFIEREFVMSQSWHRHDITDHIWELLEPHLPGREGAWGGVAQDNRRFINAVLWILRTGAPWRDLPSDYGDWKNTHRRFCRWRDKGIWENLLEVFIDEPDLEWLIIDASHVKVHQHGTGAIGGNQDMGRTKGGSTQKYMWPWMRMAIRSEYLLQRVPERIVRKLRTL